MDTNTILHERAIKLAKEEKNVAELSEKLTSILEFRLGNEIYGIESTLVERVHKYNVITPIPGTPDSIPGVINMHGNIICIINLKYIFDIKDTKQCNIAIIAEYKGIQLGFCIDSIEGINSHDVSRMQKSVIQTSSENKCIKGLLDNRVILLDLDKIINIQNLINT